MKVTSDVLGKGVVASLQQFRKNYVTQRKKGHIVRDVMPYGNVLIVDDVETNLYVAVGLMKIYKLQIDTAMRGQEVIDKIKDGKVYDVIFMDHMMPEMDGIETTKHLRDLGYTAPIVALTANAVAGQADIFLQNSFNGFISKPIDIRQLNSILNKFIRDKQPQEIIEQARQQNTDKLLDTSLSYGIKVDSLLLESFIRDARKAEALLNELFGEGGFEHEVNLQKFTISVHGIKSSLLIVGETELARLAYKLETAGRDKNIDLITASTPDLLNGLHTLLEKFESKQNENDLNNGNQESFDDDIEGLRNKLLAVQEMCKNYDKKGATKILSEIKKCSKETRKVLDNIMIHMLHSEFEEAGKAAFAYASGLS